MLNNPHYYHSLLRKYVVYFGSLFNDITIERRDQNEQLIQTIAVPISYGPKQKFIARLEQDPNAERESAIVLPRMSFQITNLQYDNQRKLNVQQKIAKQTPNNSSQLSYAYTPVPYNISFDLSIYSKNAEDGIQVIEQILPFFAPEWTNQLILIPELDIRMDIPISIEAVRMDDLYEGKLEIPRYIVSTIRFTMKAYLFGPIRNSGIIKRITTNLMLDDYLNDNYIVLEAQSNADPIFKLNDFVYQTVNNQQVANGIVQYSNSTHIEIKEYSGKFISNTIIYSSNSNSIANVQQVNIITRPKVTTVTTPALLANGQPTTNSQLSIPIDYIKSTDNYGIAQDISEF